MFAIRPPSPYVALIAIAACACAGGGTERTTSPVPPPAEPAPPPGPPDFSALSVNWDGCAELRAADLASGGLLSAGCYDVLESLEVHGPLLISAGAHLRFSTGVGLFVGEGGRLTVRGTEAAPVSFEGLDEGRGSWIGIQLDETGDAHNALEHVLIRGAGSHDWASVQGARAGVFVKSEVRLTLVDCVVTATRGPALTVIGGTHPVIVERCAFSDNVRPAFIHANVVGGLRADNRFDDNDDDAVWLVWGSDVSSPQRWGELPGAALRWSYALNVGARLELAPGLRLEPATPEARLAVVSGGELVDAP